jgi:hypothetical protein
MSSTTLDNCSEALASPKWTPRRKQSLALTTGGTWVQQRGSPGARLVDHAYSAHADVVALFE